MDKNFYNKIEKQENNNTPYEITTWAAIIRNKFLADLENNKVPWDMPYRNALAYNFTTAGNNPKPYILLNQILLEASGERIFATAAQIQNLNSPQELERIKASHFKAIPKIHIKAGSKAQKLISSASAGWNIKVPKTDPRYEYAKKRLKEATEQQNSKNFELYKVIIAELKEADLIKYQKGFTVYNNVFSIDNIDGLEPERVEHFKQKYREFNNFHMVNDVDLNNEQRADRMIDAYFEANPQIKRLSLGIGTPNYSYSMGSAKENEIVECFQSITLPVKEQSKSLSEYYSTVFHEISHSQIKDEYRKEEEQRQKREKKLTNSEAKFNRYAIEEFQVEMTTYIITHYLNIASPLSEQNNISYCKGWKDKILGYTDQELYNAVDKACKAAENLIQTYDKTFEKKEEKGRAEKEAVATISI